MRALHALQGADIVFYDELVTPEILDRARRDAERVFVGKRSGAPGVGQDAVNRRLRDAARRGLNVVRLKGGDPFLFGRGGEELQSCAPRRAECVGSSRASPRRWLRRGGRRPAADPPERRNPPAFVTGSSRR